MYVKPGSSQVGSIGFNGVTQLFSSGGVTPPAGSYSTIDGLWITETANNVFSDGYAPPPAATWCWVPGLPLLGSDIGNSIGFYADLRGTLTSAATLSNLTIQPVPEPSTLALWGMGFLGLVVVMRRKQQRI